MIYPIGHSTLRLPFEHAATGGLLVDGVLVTDAEGWLEVGLPARADAPDAPAVVSLRVRVERAPGNRWFINAERVRAGGRSYDTLFELVDSGAWNWLQGIASAVDEAIARQLIVRRGAP